MCVNFYYSTRLGQTWFAHRKATTPEKMIVVRVSLVTCAFELISLKGFVGRNQEEKHCDFVI